MTSLDYCPGMPKPVVMYGSRLKLARQARGWTKKQLSDKSGAPVEVLRALESSVMSYVCPDFAKALAPWLGVTAGFFAMEPTERLKGGFVCQIAEPCHCGNMEAPLLCDHKAPGDIGTCDQPLCDECTTKRGELDLCLTHKPRPNPGARRTPAY